MSDRLGATKRRPARRRWAGMTGYLTRTGLAQRVAQAQVIRLAGASWGRRIGPGGDAESVTPDGVLFVRVTPARDERIAVDGRLSIMARLNAGRGSGRSRRYAGFSHARNAC